jgi:flavorubredoxin
MAVRQLKPNIFSVGAIDWDRRLFDELIPLPDGTSYNAYIIKGSEKVALLDTVDPTKEKELIENLRALKIDKIDFVIAHHAEQDHSGSIPKILELYPMAVVVTNPKCKEMLKDHLKISDAKIMTLEDSASLSLGDKTLQFIYTPWVHWPDTMCSYLKEDRILFSCDFFGAHLATDDLFAGELARACEEAKRYYAEIMMPFRAAIKKNIEKISGYEIEMIATSHGPVYDRPEFIIESYREWISDEVSNTVVIPYVSMHGSTQVMVDFFIDALVKRGISVKPFNLPRTDMGELAKALVDAATLVIGTSTVLVGPHPQAVYAAYLANAMRVKAKFVSIIGSYGWGGKAVETLCGMLTNLKVEIIPPVLAKGYPKDEDFASLDKLAEEIANRHKGVI